MERYLTKRKLLLVLAFVFLLIAWNRSINLLYGMFSLLSATLVLSHLLPKYSLNGVTAKRDLPTRAFEGEDIELLVSVRNGHWKSRYMVEVFDAIPAAAPDLKSPMTFVGKLPGRTTREYTFKVGCTLRGEYTVGPLTLRSAYPLGISTVEKTIPGTTQPLLVYPQVFNIAHLPLMAGSNVAMGGAETVSRAAGNDEFLNIREYREGDGLKYIHWSSTARHAQLIVKELETRGMRETTIIMDLHTGSICGEGKESNLEYAVKVAASMSKYAIERGHRLQLMGYGSTPCIVSYGGGLTHFAGILEALARVKADGSLPYHRAVTESVDLLKDGGTVILLFARTDGELNDYLYGLNLLKAKKISLIAAFFDETSFQGCGSRDERRRRPSRLMEWFLAEGIPVYLIAGGDDLEGVFSL